MAAKNSNLARVVSLSLQTLLFIYVAVSVVYNAVFDISAQWLRQPDIVSFSRRYIQISDPIDMGLLTRGIRAKPTFFSTFDWWRHSWAGLVPFWRPLTSQFFWIEYRLFGFDRLDEWQWIGIISHLLFVATLAVLLSRMTGNRWVAAIAALCFAGAQTLWPMNLIYDITGRTTPANVAMDSWKNQVEMWGGTCVLGAILFALNKRWALSLVCVAAGICFKESGWLAYLFIPLALWADGKARGVPRWVIGIAGVLALALIALRASAGWSVFYGYHMGSDHNALTRYLDAVEGYFLDTLFSPNAGAALAACLIFALAQWKKGNAYLRTGIGIVGLAGCILINSRLQFTTFGIAAAEFLEPNLQLGRLICCLLYVMAAYAVLTSDRYRKVGLALAAMVCVSGVAVAAAVQITEHASYLIYSLECGLLALGIAAAIERIGADINQSFPRVFRLKSSTTEISSEEVSAAPSACIPPQSPPVVGPPALPSSAGPSGRPAPGIVTPRASPLL